MPHLSQIWIFPIKSLDGIAIDPAAVLPSGALQHDRRYAIVDSQGNFINGKRTAAVHKIRAEFDLAAQTVSLRTNAAASAEVFELEGDRRPLETWLSDYFGFPVQIVRNLDTGFPDDTAASGATVISTATLAAIASWFPDLSLAAVRQRFRTNLEIADVEPFWEDSLFGEANQIKQFQIGQVQFEGINPCQRCIVPVRDPSTGQVYPNFQKTFITQRQATLPATVARSRFNHFYRLAVNTRIAPSNGGSQLQVGDRVTLLA